MTLGENAQRVQRFFQELNAESMHLVQDFYSERAYFEDPIGSHGGVTAIRAYYEGLYKSVDQISFSFEGFTEQGDSVVARWVMKLVTPKMNGGRAITLPGISYLEFEGGKAKYHRDYFDMGAFVYEQLPLLKHVIRFVKDRLRG